MTDTGSLSYGLAFGAGLVSFLSPCVLPLVPSYLTFVTGMSVDDLTAADRGSRWIAMRHALLFVLGFGSVFVALGAAATALGAVLAHSLAMLQHVGGIVVVVFGLYLLGALRIHALSRERRLHLSRRPAGLAGSFLVGMAFGAGWTPCVGPVLASILLYAGTTGSVLRGEALLATYTLGLGLPFLGAAFAFEWFVARRRVFARWVRPLEIVTGVLLVAVGAMLASGRFNTLTGFLAGFGQLITIGT
ncbi:MAG: cytochrome c biogenesis protein CcdA [Gemmatimonadaceae bacterium]